MSKINWGRTINQVGRFLQKHSPEFLTGFGVAGMLGGTILAVKATPKAIERLQKIDEKYKDVNDKKAYAKEVVTKVAPCYIPAVLSSLGGAACVIGATSVNLSRNAALATAYSLSETAAREYRDKVIETRGEKEDIAIRESIAKDRVEHGDFVDKEVIVASEADVRMGDPMSGRAFWSTIDKVKQIENELNRQMRSDNYISLNDLYYEVGLESTEAGRILGWNINRGYIQIRFIPVLDKDGKVTIMLDYRDSPPVYDFDRL